ncbi:hypothetical protein HLB44_22915 [Aquincola sp. S2]|uniref:Tfp pilus assembly protein FimV n=1 Tax=Pseudaquabacterium terrae TaxID=2732868 RepID=A0ABX2EMR8_9BURK|nr:hypothetical protein [Aquabacterium terrae]NRF69862.1 hypothetical protein [Aquabacterium terrae]
MHLIRSLAFVLCGLLLSTATTAARAIGFGPPPSQVTLGSPLNFALPLRIDPAETFDAACVHAEASFGDRRVAPHHLRWMIEAGAEPQQRLLRVVSLVAVDEPVVTVQVSSTCGTRITRRFTAFADPPLLGAQVPSSDVAQGAVNVAVMAVMPAVKAASAAARPTRAPMLSKAPAERRAKQRPKPVAPAAMAAAPRLSLEAADPELIAKAVAAALAEQQASAVHASVQSAATAAAAASATAARVRSLEEQVERLSADSRQQRDQLQQLRARAASGDTADRWMPPLIVAVGALLLLASWLALRLRQVRQEAQDKWYADAAAVLADVQPDPVAEPAPLHRSAAPPPDLSLPIENAPASTLGVNDREHPSVAPTLQAPVTAEPAWNQTSPPPRPVSAEELIDLEQQAEFFSVLGQEEAAIDLLVAHLRDTGGTSPLPYLKLLEIQRRLGDRAAHERTRSRFNQRFNAYAPDWDTDPQQSRLLEDYPRVIARLQRAWPQPIDAMAELETLLFRKDDGELFDLPAYRELLIVYAIARELADDAAPSRIEVDLLLPLDAASARMSNSGTLFDTTAPLPHLSLIGETTMVLTPGSVIERPAPFQSVDVDLSAPADAPAPVARGRRLRR